MGPVRRRLHRVLALAALVSVACVSDPPRRPLSNPVVIYEQSFAEPASLDGFEFSDPDAWQHAMDGEQGCLELHGASDYAPTVRSPRNIALVLDRSYGSFTLDVEMRQTGREYGHRDLCVFFGMQSPTRFYYVHMASVADPNAHNIFRVQDAPRTNIAERTSEGVAWGSEWHQVRIRRDLKAGTIQVFFDDMEHAIMETVDRTFGWGRIGVGSFDDTGRFRNLRITGDASRLEKAADRMFPRTE